MDLESLLERRDIPSEAQEVIKKELSEFEAIKARLEYLLKSGPAIIYACEAWGDCQTKFMSENVKDILGYDSEDFLYNPSFWVDKLHPEDREQATASFSKILDTEFFSETYRFQQKDGTYRWMLEEANLIRDEQGNPLEIVGYWTDITERKHTEIALQESEEKYRSFVENFQGIAFKGYEDFSAGFFLGKVEEITGYTENDFISGEIAFNQLIHPKDIPQVNTDVEKFMSSSQKATQREYRIINRNGSLHWIQESVQKFYDEKLKKRGVYGTLMDITERKLAEEALRESQELFTQFMDHLPVAAFIKDKDSVTLFANKFAKEVFGGEKWIGKTATELFPEEAARKMIADDQKTLTEGLKIITEELRDINNIATTYRTYKFPIQRKNKQHLLGGISFDVTLLQKTEDLLRKERENFYNILNTINDLIYIVNSEFEIEFVNAVLEEEYDKGAVGNKCYKYFNGFDKPCSWCTMQEVLEGEIVRWEKTRERNQQTYDIIDYPLRDPDGNISLLSILRNITERKQTEEALRESELKFRTFIETLPQPVWIYQDYQCRYANPAAEKVTGHSMEDLCSMNFWDFLHPDYKDLAITGGKILEKGAVPPVTEAIVKIITKDEKEKWLDTRLELTDYENKRATLITAMDVSERIEAEEAMRRSEERLRAFMDAATDSISIWDSKLNLIDCNDAMLELLPKGTKKEDVIGRNLSSFDPRMTEVQAYQQFLEVVKTGKSLTLEGSPPYLNEHRKILLVTAFKVGNGLGMITTDITERKQAEEALRESEEKYRSFIMNFQGIAFRGYEDYTQDFFLGKVREITGYSESDFLSKKIKFKDLIHPKDSQRVANDVTMFYSSSKESHCREYRILDRYGTVHWLEEDLKKFYNKVEKKEGVYGTIQDITERKRAEIAVRESEEKWRTLVENAPDIILTVDQIGNILFINHPPVGMTVEDAIGTSVYDYVEPKYRKIVKQSIEKVFQTSEPGKYEIAARGPYNEKSWYTTQLGPIRHNGDVQAVLLITRDITERKQAEEALKKSEEKYRLLFELAPIGIGISNHEGRVLEANHQILEIMGYTFDEVKKINLGATYVNPEDRENLIKRLQDERQVQDYEVQLKRKDETPYYSLLNINLMELGDQEVYLTTQRDLTEWKEMDKAKRETEERLRKFMESATDGFTLLDSKLNFININKAGSTGFGLAREEVIGKNFLDVFPKLKDSKTFEKFLEVLKTGLPYYIDDIDSAPRIRGKYYSVRTFKVGEGLGIIMTDISDRVKAEKTREELEQRRDSFVWMTSHELRTPLTVLTGYCDFLMEHINDLAQQRITNILGVMKSNLDRLERLTSKVSTIGQIERGIFEIEKISINFCDFLQDTLEPYHQLLGNQFESQGCLEKTSIIIDGDPHRLQQVIDNLIGNAIKQTDKDRRKINIQTKIFPSNIEIKVTDNGAGIEAENLDVIFDQFVSIPTEFSATGTGIGLYLCQKTLEAHGGRITAKSQGPGSGSTFTIELPRTNSINS
jgi:PAS domain S-box-containing protein